MRIGEIINALEEWAPPVLQESYDNSGLIVGALDWETSGVLVALDCLESVLDEAIEKKGSVHYSTSSHCFQWIKTLQWSYLC